MQDLFISCAREDRATAQRLAHALATRGWSVWWDREVVPGQHFDQEIEGALAAAQAMLVLWSPAATAEAAVAADDPAARIAGLYRGAIISDSQGPSRTGIELQLTRIGAHTVRTHSAQEPRLTSSTLRVSRAGDAVVSDDAATALYADLRQQPLMLTLTPGMVPNFSGRWTAP
jgi:hypothetical protein